MFKIRWSPSSLELSLSSFTAIPIFQWSAGAIFLLSGCRGCGYLANDDVFQRNVKLIVLQCRSEEPEVRETLRHQPFDCKHLFLISDFANLFSNLFVSLMNVLRMSTSCSTSLARSRPLMLLTTAACAEFLSDMFL